MPLHSEVRAPVGTGLPAKNVNDNASVLTDGGVLESFASKLAPTEDSYVDVRDTCNPHIFLKKNFKSRRTSGTKSAALSGYSLMVEQ